jgi:hypothetical protein
MNLGALLQETANPRPAEIPESSGEQFPLYIVAPGAAPLRPATGGLSVKKGRKSDFCAAARHWAERADFFLGYHRIKTRRGTNRLSRHRPNGLRVARRTENPLSQSYCGRKCGSEFVCQFRTGSQGAARRSLETGQIPSTKRCRYRLRGKLKLRK